VFHPPPCSGARRRDTAADKNEKSKELRHQIPVTAAKNSVAEAQHGAVTS
jgi:hypothetical protein